MPIPPRPLWSDVLASIEDGVIVVDAGGAVAEVNPAAEQLTGLSAPHLLGQSLATLFDTHGGNGWLADMVHDTLTEGVARRQAEGVLVRHREEIPVSIACAPVHAADRVNAGVVLVLRELTLQHRLEAAAIRADRLAALAPVAAGLAHEIRNPLGGIKGAAQLLRGMLTTADQVACTEVIIREVDRLDLLVEQLRDLTPRPQLALGPVNIHRVLADVLALQRQAPEWDRVRLRTEFDPSLPPVHGTTAALTQVFLNLIRNALQALCGTGDLVVASRMETLRVRRGGDRRRHLSIAIEDTGSGVPLLDQAHLFTPFFTTRAHGSGLGLAICHRIVTEHDGTILYEAVRSGGARFRVTLPVHEDDGHR